MNLPTSMPKVSLTNIQVKGNKNRLDPLNRMEASMNAAKLRGLEIMCILCNPVVFKRLARRFRKSLGFREKEQFKFEGTLIVKDTKGITSGQDFHLVCRKPQMIVMPN